MTALADPPAADTVVRSGAHLLRLEDYLLTRATEGVVHGLDLPTPVQPDPGALRATVRLLTGILGSRAAGRSVEVRVPPYAAVQLDLPDAPGPRHTRGTPPNVVEADPVAFVEVATGLMIAIFGLLGMRHDWAPDEDDGGDDGGDDDGGDG